ncbi:hypothetical protein O3G_MSEX006983 [Manduca sexta]|uniref:CFA20 domain-containing protein n=1 Tax=Manduca sexta TaxID=7130 RepID=A0A922CMB8_MANSE|nr:hypothetical protein O3G_MSEX006983 [Manduca sexta]
MEVQNGHIKRITDTEVNSIVLEIVSTNVATTFIRCPKQNQILGIKLPFLVMIVKNLKRLYTEEELPQDYKLYLPLERKHKKEKVEKKMPAPAKGARAAAKPAPTEEIAPDTNVPAETAASETPVKVEAPEAPEAPSEAVPEAEVKVEEPDGETAEPVQEAEASAEDAPPVEEAPAEEAAE